MNKADNTLGLGLVEQAASCVNMLTPADLSDVQTLATILDQIGNAARGMCAGPGELQHKLEGTTTEAASVLQQILQQDVQDTAKAWIPFPRRSVFFRVWLSR